MSSYIDIHVESPFEGQFDNNVSIHDQMTADNGVSHTNFYADVYWRPMTSPAYSPSTATYDDMPSPSSLSDSSALEYTQHYDTQQDPSLIPHSHALNSPAMSNSPFDSLPPTPKSEEQVAAHVSDNYSYPPDRPEICVDTALLVQPNRYEGGAIVSTSQEVSPGLLSPHSFMPEPKPLQRRHSHSRSMGDNIEFDLGDISPNSRLGRGHQRTKSAPTSRHHSPYQRFDIAKNVSNIRSISPTSVQQPCGPFYPSKDLSPISPSDSVGKQVATERIRKASTDRRKYQPNCFCKECGDTFTTNFARDRHMKSHSGERDFVCTIRGCGQKFTTDSGRKRHEKSKTLHVGPY